MLAVGDEAMLCRPCADCGLVTGRFCDWCFAADRVPCEQWAYNQQTPLCSRCDNRHGACHFCRGLDWCTPPPRRGGGPAPAPVVINLEGQPPKAPGALAPAADAAGASGADGPLPVRAPARLQGAGSEADAPDADARLVALVGDILKTHDGEFDPSWISQKNAWDTFDKLLKPGGLKGFVEKHSDKFAWRLPAGNNKGMLITWANWVTQEEPVPPPWERPATGEVAPLPLACPAVATAPQQGVASGSGLKRPEGAADAMGFPPPKSGGPVPRSHPNPAPPTHRPQEAASGSGQKNALPLAWPDNSPAPPSGSGQEQSNPFDDLD